MSRLLYAVFAGIVGAGIVHIAILMLIPRYAQHDVWTQLGDMGADGRFVRVEPAREGQAGTLIKTADPLFAIAACRFDLTGGLTHITAPGNVPFWSVSIFDRKGENIYSFNDRNSTDGRLDLTVASPLQMVELRKDLPAQFMGRNCLRFHRTRYLQQPWLNEPGLWRHRLAGISCCAAQDGFPLRDGHLSHCRVCRKPYHAHSGRRERI